MTLSGMPAFSTRVARSSSSSPASSSSVSSLRMARSCSRRMCSRCELLIVFWTSSWILVRSCATSTSRASSGMSVRRRRWVSVSWSSATRSSKPKSGQVLAMSAISSGCDARAIATAVSAPTWAPALTYSANSVRTDPNSASTSVPSTGSGGTGVTVAIHASPRGVEGLDADALLALDERVSAATGKPPERADVGDDGDGVHVVDGGFVALGVALDGEDDPPVAVHRRLERRDRARPPGGERRQLRREHDVVPERHRRERQRRRAPDAPERARRRRGLDIGHPTRIAGAFRASNVDRDARLPVATPRGGVVGGGAGVVDMERGLPVAAEAGRAPVRRGDRAPQPSATSALGVPRGGSRRVHAADRKRQRRQQLGVRRVRESRRAGARSRRRARTPRAIRSSSRRTGAAPRDARRERSPAPVVGRWPPAAPAPSPTAAPPVTRRKPARDARR